MKVIEYLKLIELFDNIITGDDVAYQKPNPMCYEILIKKYNIDKANVVIFEDSKVGIEAAKLVTKNVFSII